MYQYWLSNCYKCTPVIQDVKNCANYVDAQGLCMASVLSDRLFCKPNCSLKI